MTIDMYGSIYRFLKGDAIEAGPGDFENALIEAMKIPARRDYYLDKLDSEFPDWREQIVQ